MSSQGPNSAGTGANTAGVGTVAWSNPGNITAADAPTDATAVLSGSLTSNYLSATNFGFSIPSGATIDGIVAECGVYKSALGVVNDNRCRIIKGGAIGATDKASGTTWPPTTPTYLSHGGVSDLWGETWLYTDINQSDFGVALSAVATGATVTARVDHVRITVYYTSGSPASLSRLCTLGAG